MFRWKNLLLNFTILFGIAISNIAAEEPGDLTQEFRIVWGGNTPRVYQGSLTIEGGQIKIVRNLSMQESALTALQQADPTKINLTQGSSTTFGGLDIAVRSTTAGRIKIQLRDGVSDRVFERTINLLDLQQKNWMENVDDLGSRIAIERQSYDRLRVETRNKSNTIFDCNSIWTPVISGYRTGIPAGEYQLIGFWANRSGPNVIDQPIRIDANGNFAEVKPEIRIPTSEGAYRLDLTIVRTNLMSTISGAKPLLNRSVDVLAFDKTMPVAAISSWHAVMALDTAAAVKPEGLSWLTSFTGSLASRALEVPGSLRIPGIDLTEQINRLIPMSKSVTNFGAVARGGQLSVRDYLVEGSSEPQRTTVIGPSSWLSLPISGLIPGKPHRLRVQVPIDYPSSLSVSVRDQSSEAESLLDPQSCLEIKEEDCRAGGTITHDFVFWPTGDSTSLLISSASRTKSGLVGKILVEAAELIESSAGSPAKLPGRQVAMYLDQPLLVECFAAPREKDPVNGRMYETWKTWQSVAERLVQQMQITKADTLVLSGMSGGNSIIPLESAPQLHRLDKATFFTDGRSPEMHDFIELLLLHLDRAGYKLILETELPNVQQPPSTLGNPDETVQTDLLGVSSRETNIQQIGFARLNPLHRNVQKALIEPIRETASRYSQHASFAGLSIRLNTNSQFLFAGDRWGYNDDLIKQFSTDSGANIAADPKQRIQLFTGPARYRFIGWRAKQLTQFYAQIARALSGDNPDVQLYLNVVQLLGRMPNESDFIDPDLIARNPHQLLLSYGIDLESLKQTAGIEIVQGSVRQSKQLLAGGIWSRSSGLEGESTVGLQQGGAVFITHQPRALRLNVESDRQKGASAEAWIYPDSTRVGRQARRIVLEQLWKSDPMLLGIGGWHPIWSCEDEVQSLLENFKQLPPVAMNEVKVFQGDSPLKLRTGNHEGLSYLSLMNLSPWEILLQLQTKGATVEVKSMGNADPRRIERNGNRLVLRVSPYELIGLVSPNANSLEVTSANYQLPDGSIEGTARRIEKLAGYLAHAADPGQQEVLFGVGGTFEQWTAANKPAGWNVSTLPMTTIQQAPELPHSGNFSILIENRNPEPATAWIQSVPIALPETGRLTLRAWLRASAADQAQPRVRLGLVGRLANGQRYQRSVIYGGNQSDPARSLSVDWGRRPAELHVTDIPVDDLVDLQVAIDLIGPGRIWVDDVEVVQSWLHPDERNYLRGQMLVVKERLGTASPFAADRLLNSPWSEYLFELGNKLESGNPGKQNVVPSGDENRADWNRSKPSIQQLRDSMRQRWIR